MYGVEVIGLLGIGAELILRVFKEITVSVKGQLPLSEDMTCMSQDQVRATWGCNARGCAWNIVVMHVISHHVSVR